MESGDGTGEAPRASREGIERRQGEVGEGGEGAKAGEGQDDRKEEGEEAMTMRRGFKAVTVGDVAARAAAPPADEPPAEPIAWLLTDRVARAWTATVTGH